MQAFPSPSGGMNRQSWKDPTVQAEFARWTDRLSFLGWDEETLERRVWAFAVQYERVRDTLIAPFRPYYRYAGTWQSWKMFIAPHTHPTRLEIEVDRGAGWELAFEERSEDHRWLARGLEHDRFRALIFRIGWPHYAAERKQFAQWVARRAAETWPDATQVKVWFRKETTRSAAEVRSGAELQWSPVLATVEPVPR